MVSAEDSIARSWAGQMADALKHGAERWSSGPDHLRVLRVEPIDEHNLEVDFTGPWLAWQPVTLRLDGRRELAADIVASFDYAADRPLETLDVASAAWIVFTLGMEEPFDPSELVEDLASGRMTRVIQAQ
ncbi:MAG: hypothetical protein QM628_15635 [Propionicimonas sp.]